MNEETALAIRQLWLWAKDPMWADHAEVPKALLSLSAELLATQAKEIARLRKALTDTEPLHRLQDRRDHVARHVP